MSPKTFYIRSFSSYFYKKNCLMTRLTKILVFAGLFFFLHSFAQQKFTLSGTVTEASSNETLIGVTIAFPELKTGVTTNEYGFYSITLPDGDYRIVVSYLGFREIARTISLNQNQKLNFSLEEVAQELQEVVVTEDSEKLDIRK